MLDRRTAMLGLAACLAPLAGLARNEHDYGDGMGRAAAGSSQLSRTYVMPPVRLVDQGEVPADLAAELQIPGPVFMNFIFTTCPGICPLLSAVFAKTASLLGHRLSDVRLWLVSIDPDYDGPAELRDYAEAFHAPPEWRFLTGEKHQIDAVRSAFDADSDNKMAHRAVVLMRTEGASWLRFEGDVTGEQLAVAAIEALAKAT